VLEEEVVRFRIVVIIIIYYYCNRRPLDFDFYDGVDSSFFDVLFNRATIAFGCRALAGAGPNVRSTRRRLGVVLELHQPSAQYQQWVNTLGGAGGRWGGGFGTQGKPRG